MSRQPSPADWGFPAKRHPVHLVVPKAVTAAVSSTSSSKSLTAAKPTESRKPKPAAVPVASRVDGVGAQAEEVEAVAKLVRTWLYLATAAAVGVAASHATTPSWTGRFHCCPQLANTSESPARVAAAASWLARCAQTPSGRQLIASRPEALRACLALCAACKSQTEVSSMCSRTRQHAQGGIQRYMVGTWKLIPQPLSPPQALQPALATLRQLLLDNDTRRVAHGIGYDGVRVLGLACW